MKKVRLNKQKNSNLKLENISQEFIPYACYFDNETIFTKAGEILQVIKIVGFTYEVLEEVLDLRATIRNAVSNNIKQSNFSFWIHTVRRKVDLDPGGKFEYYFAAETHEAWCKKNYWHDKYVNELYITIVYRNLEISIKSLKQLLTSFSYFHQTKYFESEFDKFHKQLNKVTNNILASLKDYGARKLVVTEDEDGPYSEHLQFFGKIIHLSESRMPLPLLNLSKYLSTHKIAFGNVNFEIKDEKNKRFGAIFSIKEYHELSLGELDNFLQLPQEMVVTQSVNFVNSKKLFKKYEYQNYILDLSGDSELSDLTGLSYMLRDLDGGATDFGNSQLTIMIMADSLNLLEEYIKKSVEKLSKLGLLIVREDLNLENCYWSQLPGNFSYLVRNSPINSKFVGGFASLYNFPAGKLNNKWGKALTLFRTSNGTPYFFNFHHEENGHTLIIGPKGSGKNTLSNFLISESCKYNPNIIIFDYNNKSELMIEALGQKYFDLSQMKFNPFTLEHNEENISFLIDWIIRLIYEDEGREEIKDYLRLIIENVYKLEIEKRNILAIFELLKKEESSDIQQELMIKFENLSQEINLNDIFTVDDLCLNKINAFETSNLDNNKYNKAFVDYVVYRSKVLLTGDPCIFVIQNLTTLSEVVDLKKWLNYLTLNNAIAIMLLEEEEINLVNNIFDVIPTQIFLPHESIKEKHKTSYGLTKAEFESFKNIKYINRHFLLKQNNNAIVAELNLSGINKTLSILTGSITNKEKIANAKTIAGQEPSKWLPVFYETID